MTLFGQTLSGEEIFGLVSMMLALVYLLMVVRGRRASHRWLNEALARREQEKQRKAAASAPPPQPTDQDKRGPWG
ncbi:MULTISPECIES: hypothetical protein [unclassified Brevundimonas]|uniref:hypothetical protein n=1 Tax=unclassified Brevundimonas TaxID=2622653 RepID=UPI0025B970D6|nr:MULTISPECIES: hypothetical protein [unclassified Brevundimonas]